MPATQVEWNMVRSPRGDGLSEDKPVRTAVVSGANHELPRFNEPGQPSPRLDGNALRADGAMAHTAHLDVPPAGTRRPASDRLPVLLPQSLYRSVDYRYWLVAVGGGMLAWWVLFHFL